MAEEKKAAEAKVAQPEAVDLTPAVQVTLSVPPTVMVVLVGCGGTGARVLPPLMQMLRPNDRVVLVDHDIVEDRNLHRQHFTSRDIGSPKALVLAERYKKEGIFVAPFQQRLEPESNHWAAWKAATEDSSGRRQNPGGVVFIGAVDGSKGRAAIHAVARRFGISSPGIPTAWIDAGNSMKNGQVILSWWKWIATQLAVKGGVRRTNVRVANNGLVTAMPQLLKESEQEKAEASCADRLDMQTVQVNMMAASAVVNIMSWLLSGVPITNTGVFFDTSNSMQPIRLVGGSEIEVFPDTTFAIKG